MANKWEIWKEKKSGDSVKPWDMINPKIEKVSKEVSEERIKICLGCDRLFKPTNQCKECGCIMTLKTQLPHAFCPLGKWDSVNAID